MKLFAAALGCLLGLGTSSAWAWGNHSIPAYRAFERMPEIALAAPVAAEPLEAFLKAEEKTIEALLASQEAWAAANLENYPARPAALAFTVKLGRSDEARKIDFLNALRVAPNSRFALFIQPDPRTAAAPGPRLPSEAVTTLPMHGNASQKFQPIKPGDLVSPLSVVASASDEPDYGLDINLWEDSRSEWGKRYGFGKQPFGNPVLPFSTQAPFHMSFMHENSVLYAAAPFIKRTFPRLRSYQYSTLASLAFRTGHPYWGWRFTGLSLHYLQDLTQPYHASLSPGDSTLKLLAVNALAMVGMEGMKNDMIVLLSNRHLALEKYQAEVLFNSAMAKEDTPMDVALRRADKDASYPEWNDRYLRDVVAAQAVSFGPRLVQTLVSTLPAGYVSNPGFDFGLQEESISLVKELSVNAPDSRANLDAIVADLLANFGAHSRNAVRGILKASNQP
ncbi:MAG: phospholipase [Rhodoferax sp.]|nr:phospholipase [Rhodoferax sp.]